MFQDSRLQQEFNQHASLMSLPAGSILMQPGQYIRFIPLVIKGCIRVLRQNLDGEETFLYHLMPGETCALSLTCCATQKPSQVKTIAEEDTELWTIPIEKLEQWQPYKEWKEFIALTYQNRFEKLLQVIDDIAFEQMDERLWRYLLARAKAQGHDTLHISHEEIAQELNIQRESATRLLKKLKDMGLIETGRNQIRILKKDFLL
ncbi:MAG: Crp/Fnr family transcriptional regulator [Chitinophagaceae bacterium]